MSLPHPSQAANVLTTGINSVNSMSRQVMNAFTNAQVSMIRTLAEAAPQLPSFTTGQGSAGMRIQFPKVEKVFSAVPQSLSKLVPQTGQTRYATSDVKGIASENVKRYRKDVAMF